MEQHSVQAVYAVAIGQEVGLPPEALTLLRRIFAPQGKYKPHEVAAAAATVKAFAEGERSFETVLSIRAFVLRISKEPWFGSPPTDGELAAIRDSGSPKDLVQALTRVADIIQPVGAR
jgi:hypothetical protein